MSSTTATPTAPLPQPAVEAMARLESSGLPVGPSTLAAQVLKSRVRAAELADLADAGYPLSPLEWDDLAHAVDLTAEAPDALAKWAQERAKDAGRLDLIGVAS